MLSSLTGDRPERESVPNVVHALLAMGIYAFHTGLSRD